ncbi:MAG: succinate dehydrogenase, cytochrome b556 subunit [Gammaproteobacteria bacterium]|nr:succinate dehydrogenase, cytochrome b556 subunit [Gammaproteobacteria bacterium]
MSKEKQPLSPHLSVYKWQITNTLSILHRFSGFILFIVGFSLSIWILSISIGQEMFDAISNVFTSPIAIALWILVTQAFFYHFLNGIRHLFWDIGKGFETRELKISGAIVVILSLILTALFWLCIFSESN